MRKGIVIGLLLVSAAAQAANGSLAAEIKRAQNEAARKNSPREQRNAWLRLGRLLHLSGDIAGAADSLMKAAYVEEGKRDDGALLGAAACYLAMGEWDKAEANTKLVLVTVYDNPALLLRAKYLTAQIEAFRSGNGEILAALLDDPEFTPFRAEIYWTLWKLSGNAEYKTRLQREYPERPETKMLDSDKSSVMEASSPQWLLPPGI